MIFTAGLTPAWQQVITVDRILAGEVNRTGSVDWCAGGKVLNVATALFRLGAPCRILSVCGGETGRQIMGELDRLGMDVRWVEDPHPTRVCTTVVELARGSATEFVENARSLDAGTRERFHQAFAEEVPGASVVVLTGSLPSQTPIGFYRDLMTTSAARFVLDIRGPELLEALSRRPFLVKPNRLELSLTLNRNLRNECDIIAAMAEVNHLGAEWVVITDGRGPVYLSTRGEVYRTTPLDRPVVNAIGSGDCLAAGIACGLARDYSALTSIRLGLAAATDNMTQLLPACIDPRRVQSMIDEIDVLRLR